jgi:DNA invertase Pin-like site-specific DNA recombinase
MATVGGYMRVSSKGDRDPDRWLTVPLQQKAITDHCTGHHHTLADLRSDIDVSGGSEERPNLEALVQRIEAGELAGLVVAKLDRFARNLAYGVRIIERIDAAGGFFIATADGFDLRTDAGRLQFHVMLSFADYELRRFKTGWRQARERLVLERGQHWGPSVPLGYRRRDDGVLGPDPVIGPLAAELFVRRANGESVSELARWLESLGVLTARGGLPSRRWVSEMLARRVYLGEAYAGELRNTSAHEPLIDRVTWERAQLARAPRPSVGREPTLLGGLVRCWHCRHVMSACWSPYAGGRKRAYRCRGRHAHGQCPRPAFALEEHLLEFVEPAFWGLMLGADVIGTPAGTDDADRVARLQRDCDRAADALVKYRDDPDILDALEPRQYAEGLRVRQRRLDDAEGKLAREIAAQPVPLGDASALRDDWPRIDVPTRRRMLHAVIGAVVVKAPDRHRDHGSPLRGRARPILPADLPVGLPKSGGNPVAVVPFPDFDDPSGAWMLPG